MSSGDSELGLTYRVERISSENVASVECVGE